MALHVISFAFETHSTRRAGLLDAIQAIGPAAQTLASQWLLISRRSQAEIFGELSQFVDERDCLIVAAIDPAKLASYNLPDSVTHWLAVSLKRLNPENRPAPPTSRGATSRAGHGVSGVCRDFPD